MLSLPWPPRSRIRAGPFNRLRKGIGLKVPMAAPSLSAIPAPALHPRLTDSHGRVIHDLRVSITDRCNYKCVYCRTGEMGAQYPELAHRRIPPPHRALCRPRHHQGPAYRRRAAACAAAWSTWFVSSSACAPLTGEPLDLALTTNGHLLESLAQPLKDAGLNRITVSMDAVDAAVFRAHHTHRRQLFRMSLQAFAPLVPPGSRLSKSIACCCAASTTIRSKALPALPAKSMSSSASSNSCRSKKAASGRRRSW